MSRVLLVCSVHRETGQATAAGLHWLFGLSLLKSPSGPKVGQTRTRASTQRMADRVETNRIGSGVAPLGIDRVESRRTRAVGTATSRDCEERVQAARV